MSEFKEQFSKRLRELRVTAGLSQEQLAEIVGVAAKTVSYWENGHNSVTFNKIPAIAKALGVPVYKLFVFGDVLTSSKNEDIMEFLGSMTERERNIVSMIIKAVLMI